MFRKFQSYHIPSVGFRNINLEASLIRTLSFLNNISQIDHYRSMWLGNVYMTLIIEMNFLWVWGGPHSGREKNIVDLKAEVKKNVLKGSPWH